MGRASLETRHSDLGRKPLGDGSQQANNTSPGKRSNKNKHIIKSKLPTPPSSGLPHHDSLAANGALTVRNMAMAASPENKRLSAVTTEDHPDSKRDSQVSNASTTASAKVRRRKTHIGPWELGKDIGKGGCGNVRKVRHRVTGEQAAVKIISKRIAEKMGAESLSNLVESSKKSSMAAFGNVMPFGIEREVVILKLLDHDNIVKLYDVWENRSELYLIMEYCDGGELFDYIDARECLGEDEAVWLLRQMLAALIHCARLGIHHRDLKPENILLDLANSQVKIVDFGMAALQPKGGYLTTPCGSIYYAAPEVFERRYDGSKADVWSLGVILYVMLTGQTPFAYDPDGAHANMESWYQMLKQGNLFIPEELSAEAADLILRMLDPDPNTRITLEQAWTHCFLRKFCAGWGEPPESMALERWIGKPSIICGWPLKRKEDIDREILRNLRTLWHSVKEDALVARILSPEPNQEKYFYYALQKHREEQLENFVAGAEVLDHSTSDYHHMKKNGMPELSHKISRTKSQFSILNDEHLHSRSSFLEPPPSEHSYDPYRASRNPITNRRHSYTNVTVRRQSSEHSRKNSIGTQSLRPPGSLRVEALKNEQRRRSTVSRASSNASAAGSRPRTARSVSRASMASSVFSSSPPAHHIKPFSKHKRPVNFSHLRRSSTASALATKSTGNLTTPTKTQRKTQHSSPDIRHPQSSPSAYNGINIDDIHVVSKKENQDQSLARPRTRRGQNTNSMCIETEARKISTELGQLCEETFFKNRSSGASSLTTSTTTNPAPYETPLSSVSNLGSSRSARANITPSASLRPLPEVPAGTPNTVVARELAETKKRFQAYAADASHTNNKAYTDIIAQIDTLLKPRLTATEPTRTASVPEQRHSYLAFLPPISEEDRVNDSEVRSSKGKEPRSASAAETRVNTVGQWENHPGTIRMVDTSSPPRPAPLNIRKISPQTNPPFKPINGDGLQLQSSSLNTFRDGLRRMASPISPGRPDFVHDRGIDEGISMANATPRKKRTWWKRIKSPDDSETKTEANKSKSPASLNSSMMNRQWKRPFDMSMPEPLIPAGLLPPELAPRVLEKRPGFLRFLRRSPRISQTKTYSMEDPLTSPVTPSTSVFSDSDRGHTIMRYGHSLESSELPDSRDLGVQQSWFARFLHIKPVTKVLCFQNTRGRIRSEMVRLLRGWRGHGIQDVIHDKARNLIFARLDAVNALGIKEVEFVIELFVVLHGRARKGLSIARFTQRKGAASSLRRIVQEIETRMGQKKYLVEDKVMRKDMEGVLSAELR